MCTCVRTYVTTLCTWVSIIMCFQVQVVHEKSTGEVYAMKVMKKAHILQQADVSDNYSAFWCDGNH